MANTIQHASKFLQLIDEVYKAESKTSILDTPKMQSDFAGVNEIKVLKTSSTGLGNYSRTTGYPKGDITATWETFKLAQERGAELTIDRMDDEETLGMVFGSVVGNFLRINVIPELDAYRFAKYSSTSNVGTTSEAILAEDTILKALDEAIKFQDENEVPQEGRMLFVNSNLQPILANSTGRFANIGNGNTINTVINEYNGIPIIYVPPTRFYTEIELKNGSSSEWGFAKASGGKSINFLLMRKDAVIQGVKHANPKIFTPDENQDKDAWKFQYRNYHDCFVYDNKVKGIYVHKSTT